MFEGSESSFSFKKPVEREKVEVQQREGSTFRGWNYSNERGRSKIKKKMECLGDKEEMEAKGTKSKEAEEKEERKEGKTVILGIRTDSKSRELLTWALVNVAVSGDRVIAVHVRRFSSLSVEGCKPYAELEPMRKAYEGFCNLRQIDLVIKICRGLSVRRALVRQAKTYSASCLILGEAKSINTIRSSLTSIPKYCATRVPAECSVVAVNNGKIVFARGAVEWEMDYHGRLSSLLLELRKSMARDSLKVQIKGLERSFCDEYRSSHCAAASILNDGLSCSAGIDLDDNALPEEKCSVCGTVSTTQRSSKEMADETQQEPILDAAVNSSSLASMGIHDPTDEVRSNWSLLQRTVLSHKRTISIDGSRTSLVQWAKWISGRPSTSSPNHSVGKHRRSDTFAASRLHKYDNLSPFHFEEGDLKMKLHFLQENYSLSCKPFSYKELVQATCNFSAERVIGKGGSSQVYKGIFPDGKELAVKTLKSSKDAVQEFVSEIEIIATLNHKNIISLLGFCFEENKLILVYEFLSRGSLDENLHGPEEQKCALSWCDRYKISIGIAEALNFLHSHKGIESVMHMDVKSSNILLTKDFEPKLSDFGLARRATETISHISCNNLAGTFGYLAPEYFMFGQISTKTDVYALGVVLLELLSGRRPISSGGIKGDQSLVMWAKPILQNGKARELLDPRLASEYDGDQVERMVLAASLCLNWDSQSRPTVPCVLKLLHGGEDSVKWAKSQVDASETISNLEYEALCLSNDIKSHHNLLKLNLEDDSSSASSTVHTASDFTTDGTSVEDYLQGRLSRSSSVD